MGLFISGGELEELLHTNVIQRVCVADLTDMFITAFEDHVKLSALTLLQYSMPSRNFKEHIDDILKEYPELSLMVDNFLKVSSSE